MIEEILRPDEAEVELETAQECAERHNIPLARIRAKFERYADQAPKPVKLRNGRAKLFAAHEMDAFLAIKTDRKKPRSGVEVTQSRVARLRASVAENRRRLAKRKEETTKAERDLRRSEDQLKEAEEYLETLRAIGG